MKWNKFSTRELTQEEREFFTENVTFIWEDPIPDVDETVLVSDGKTIWTEDWVEYDEGLGLEDSDAEGLYWMPLPELPKEEEFNNDTKI
ncbi:hypothetical protein [Streptococcus anginosus]|uniref:hypothetical protein n=1 Tax=Streptococcus anginosus TaxID=1328 RepID=UPI00308202D2|nr:hypothetical protein LPZ00_000484 [Streptococcus anginosus]